MPRQFLFPVRNSFELYLTKVCQFIMNKPKQGLILLVVAEILVIALTRNAGWAVVVWLSPIPVIWLVVAWIHHMTLRGIGYATENYAKIHALRYIRRSKLNYSKHFQPSIAKLGVLERKEYIAKGIRGDYPYETYIFSYRHLQARRYTRIRFRVYCIDLPKELPHIFIRNKRSNKKVFGSLPRHFDDDQRIDLEGNFPDFFTVYTHRRTYNETLSILAPNVMRTILDSNQHFDVEFVGNKLFFYSSMDTPAALDLEAADHTIQVLMKHIEHRLKSWKFVLPNNKHYPYLVSRPGYGTMSIGGKYYNRSWRIIAFYTAYVALHVSNDSQHKDASLIFGVLIIVAMISLLLVMRHRYQLQNRNVGR